MTGHSGLGSPCTTDETGTVIDCGAWANVGRWVCWNPFMSLVPCVSQPPGSTGPIYQPGGGADEGGSSGGDSGSSSSLLPSGTSMTFLAIGVIVGVVVLIKVIK